MFAGFLKGLLALVYPSRCLVCKAAKKEEEILCRNCFNSIKKIRPPFCQLCGASVEDDDFLCRGCRKSDAVLKQAWSVSEYEGVMKECVHLFKYNSKLKLNRIFKRLISDFLADYHLPLENIDFIVPVPLHVSRLREREFNQAQILAEDISEESGLEVEHNLIRRHRNTASQVDLTKRGRFDNVKGAFSIDKNCNLDSKNILLVDDVFTTGATLREVALTLKQNGANHIYALTLAHS